ncbi:MAG: ribonuclease [Bacillota bacterium]|nr:ribonuclease [Bacillota bacterium]
MFGVHSMKKEDREKKERDRLAEMMQVEQELYRTGVRYIAGVDEVGRGPLAGPVVAAAVILPDDFSVLGVDDSKKLSEKKREALYDLIIDHAVAYSVGITDNYVIDKINILEATKLAMRKALNGLSVKPEYILIDALTLKDIPTPQRGIIKGDSISVSIAAASIIAKVTRDRLMKEYHERFPQYAFDQNKGYGTKAHYEGINCYGTCLLHRRSFLKSYFMEEEVTEACIGSGGNRGADAGEKGMEEDDSQAAFFETEVQVTFV